MLRYLAMTLTMAAMHGIMNAPLGQEFEGGMQAILRLGKALGQGIGQAFSQGSQRIRSK